MARRPRRPSPRSTAEAPPTAAAQPGSPSPGPSPDPTPTRSPTRIWLVAGGLLVVHWVLAASSLVLENPTIDEIAHLPAGLSYWQKGTFRLYPHNPPLIKLAAALPVLLSGPRTTELYQSRSWTGHLPDQATFGHQFAVLNADRYFALFSRGRLVIPAFSVLGGLVVFAWSRRLYGDTGGLLSLALWAFCPNILAHARLVTTDVGATALGVAATYVFWRCLHRPTWAWATAAGLCLGLAQLAKFSMLLLYGIWPLLWLLHELSRREWRGLPGRVGRSAAQGLWIVALSILTIDAGYGFEGVGIPLGHRTYEFACRSLTRPVEPGTPRPRSENELIDIAWQHRVNRFRATILEQVPAPLPKHYLLGFDEQKIESEGVPKHWWSRGQVREADDQDDDEIVGYPVYLDGELRRTGWRSYYLRALAYKVPEGTLALVLLSLAVLVASPRSRAPWADELALLAVPVTVLVTMSLLTDINLGLRYVLPIFPYLFIASGKLAPWAEGLLDRRRSLAACGVLAACLTATAVSTLAIHPHYLAYFNRVSGGPARGSGHLIDSNLDWGQDLVNLKRWLDGRYPPDQPIGLAYFGQINPNLFAIRGEAMNWFLAPGRPGTLTAMPIRDPSRLVGPAPGLKPGLYAVSATLLRGLPWRLYDPSPYALTPAWRADYEAFSYFQELTPIASIGHSIFVYELRQEDVDRLSRDWARR